MVSEQKTNSIESPCVSICALDENDICVGCHRTGEEITNWGPMSNTEKARVMEHVREREQKAYI